MNIYKLVTYAAFIALSLNLISCTESNQKNREQQAQLIRLFDDAAVAFQARQNALKGTYTVGVPVTLERLHGWPRFSVAQVPEYCQFELQDGRLEPAAVLKAGNRVLPYVDHPDELLSQKAGWTFLRRNVLNKKVVILANEPLGMRLSIPNSLEQLTLVMPLRNEDMTLEIYNDDDLIHSAELTGQRHLTLPAKLLPEGIVNLRFHLTQTGPRARKQVQVSEIVFGSSDRIIAKGASREDDVSLSYFASEPEHYRALNQVFLNDYFPDEIFVKSPFFKPLFTDNSKEYQRLMRAMLMVSKHSLSHTLTLNESPMEMRFSYGIDERRHPAKSALTVLVESSGPEKRSLVRAYPFASIQRKEWHDAVIPLSEFAGETVTITFSFDSDVDGSLGDYSCIVGDPVILPQKRQPDDVRKNVILISLDTLRGDRLSGMGWMRETTPFLDKLIKKGLVYSNFHSFTSWTLPSHKTMLTGFHDIYLTYLSGSYQDTPPLTRYVPSAASYFRAAGYQTLAMVNSGFMAGVYGFERDFDQYWDHMKPWGSDILIDGQLRRKKHLHWQAAPQLLEDFGHQQPFFLFLHTYSPHYPYSTVGHEHHWYTPETDDVYAPDLANREEKEETQLFVDHVNRIYDRNLRRTDAELKMFFDFLEDEGFLENTIIVITADHGELLGERPDKLAMHGNVWEQVLHVPLIIIDGDSLAGQRVETRATLRDIVPTLLDLADLQIPDYLPGQSLLQTDRQPTSFIAKHFATDDKTIAFVHESYKLHLDPEDLLQRGRKNREIALLASLDPVFRSNGLQSGHLLDQSLRD